MAGKQYNVDIEKPREGIIRSAVVSDGVADPASMELLINLNCDSIGALRGRLGLEQYAPAATAGGVISYGVWSQNASSNRRLLKQIDDEIYSWDGATWTSVRNLSNNNKARFAQYINLTYMVNGSGNDPVRTFNGTSFGTTNVGTLPAGDFVNAGFEGRVWVADATLDRLFYTDVVEDNPSPPPDYTIGGGSNFIEKLSPQDGDQITGLAREPRALLVFKRNAIFRVYGANLVDPYPAYFIGTYSQESIVRSKDGHYFHHSSGFYKFQYETQPKEISRRIYDFVEAIPRSRYDDIFGWHDDDHIYWYVGDITIKGRELTNLVYRYTISTQVWTIYSYAQDLTASVIYDDGNTLVPLVGTSTGISAEVNKGTTDLGEEIFCEALTRKYQLGEDNAKLHSITGMAIEHDNATGVDVAILYDNDLIAPDDIGTLDENAYTLFPNFVSKDFNNFRVQYRGVYNGTPPLIEGATLLCLEEKGYEKN